MSDNISVQDRKLLWGKSGSRCSICKVEIIQPINNNLIVAEEAHIIAKKPGGARYISGLKSYNIYENLILLCAMHHKEVDHKRTRSNFSIETLKKIKLDHEIWIQSMLNKKPVTTVAFTTFGEGSITEINNSDEFTMIGSNIGKKSKFKAKNMKGKMGFKNIKTLDRSEVDFEQ